MEKICQNNAREMLQQDFVVVQLINLLDIRSIIRIRQVNRGLMEAVDRENYSMFLKLKDYLHIPSTFDSSDLASKESILSVFK